MRRMLKDDRAVSETLGYILLFGIVLTSIVIILLVGNGILDNAKSQNNFKSVEQGFSVVSSDLKQVALESTPVKTAMIQLNSGSIIVNNTSNRITVSFNGYTYDNSTGNITFLSGSDPSAISIEDGGLWEKYDVNSSDIVVLKPRIFNVSDTVTNKNTLELNIIRLNGSNESVGGSSTFDVTLRDQGSTASIYNASSPADVTITLDTGYPRAWASFLESDGAVLVSGPTSHNFTVKFPLISRLIISEHRVGVSLG